MFEHFVGLALEGLNGLTQYSPCNEGKNGAMEFQVYSKNVTHRLTLTSLYDSRVTTSKEKKQVPIVIGSILFYPI